MTQTDIEKVANTLGDVQRDALSAAWIEDSRCPANVPALGKFPDCIGRYAPGDWRYSDWRHTTIKAVQRLVERGLMRYDGDAAVQTHRPVRITNDGRAVARYLEERGW